ncbi:isoprenylcysteine carboxylmethyltransferase family protein [Candidatus Woesearchaeota archaeon]|nr:isoprenylcysteine carboxylmethyltransferase family protein [Candidatus Woesearchaeota archaeon]
MMPLKIKPPFIALFYLLLSIALGLVLLGTKVIFFPYNLIGILVAILGFFLIFWAGFYFKKKGTPRNPFEKPIALVAEGPFRFTRNPMYAGLTLILLGIAVSVGTIPMFLAPIAFFFTISILFVPYEEKRMTRLFGKEYLQYKKRVRRWI